ncbi:MAG: response regulator [Gaiellaceae bacterium]
MADDEAGIRLLCRVNLQVAGVEVLEAGDGTAALAIARRERPDLILLDVMMPELDGIEVARRLQAEEETRDIPIVFLTARAGADDRRRGYAAGGIAYIVKPFDPIVLADYIEGLLEAIGRGEREALRKRIVEER